MKAVFFDIDGTLWNGNGVIPDSTVTAIHKLQKAGNLAFINTGRSRGFVRDPKLLSIGFDGYVCGCGTYLETKEGKILLDVKLGNELLSRALHVVEACNLPTIFEGNRYLYLDYPDFYGDAYTERLIVAMGDDLRELRSMEGRWEVCKFSSKILPESDLERAERELAEYFRAVYHPGEAVEYIPLGFDKGTGIREVEKLYGIAHEDTYAVGDSANDLEMLAYAGVGICMGNGTKAAMAAADYVTARLEDDGIYKAMEHFGLFD